MDAQAVESLADGVSHGALASSSAAFRVPKGITRTPLANRVPVDIRCMPCEDASVPGIPVDFCDREGECFAAGYLPSRHANVPLCVDAASRPSLLANGAVYAGSTAGLSRKRFFALGSVRLGCWQAQIHPQNLFFGLP
jgi:hypothetical protein